MMKKRVYEKELFYTECETCGKEVTGPTEAVAAMRMRMHGLKHRGKEAGA